MPMDKGERYPLAGKTTAVKVLLATHEPEWPMRRWYARAPKTP